MNDSTTRDKPELAEALDGIARLYEDNLKNYGQTSKSVGWKDERQQLLRFEKLAEVLDAGDAEVTVADLGCGYGAMLRYLGGRPGVRLARYVGYDISDEMLAAARAAAGGDARASFVRGAEVSEDVDYSFVSGTFNVRMEVGEEVWKEYVLGAIRNLAERSRRGFAFNLLSTYVDWKQENLYYGDPLFFFDFCKRNVSPHVSLLHDYPLYEWTLVVRKGERA